ncbi:MAG: hypothetical protein IJV22_00700 [Bacteroidales bacterium]|nr:hypothetical protein [Bacteroidales bacterium]
MSPTTHRHAPCPTPRFPTLAYAVRPSHHIPYTIGSDAVQHWGRWRTFFRPMPYGKKRPKQHGSPKDCRIEDSEHYDTAPNAQQHRPHRPSV